MAFSASSGSRPCRFRAHRRRWRATVTLNPRFLSFPPLPAPLPPLGPAPSQVSTENNANAKHLAWGTAGAAALRPGARRTRAQNPGAGGRRHHPRGDRAVEGVEVTGRERPDPCTCGCGGARARTVLARNLHREGGRAAVRAALSGTRSLSRGRGAGKPAGKICGAAAPSSGPRSALPLSVGLRWPAPQPRRGARRDLGEPTKTNPGHLSSFWRP